MKKLKLGSLFDGSGGFPLAGVLNGIEPVWASEIEPFPIRVTKERFPNMKHLGSVTDINGAEIEPVDIITFGSPCQDLSVAGKQLGIHNGERSNLFFEAIRIIKEMREHDRATGRADVDLRPRFAVWENVPGAFSSNKGKDFQAVLQAFCEIRGGANHIVPMPPKNKWLPFGTIVGDGWSVAWRIYDAQFWGVPQRRKRIYLIADFGSERAGEILSECESVSGHSEACGKEREGTSRDAKGSAGGSGGARVATFIVGQGAKAGGIAYCDDGSTQTIKSAPSGGNTVPDVCYPINTMVATRGGKDDMRTCFGIGKPGDPQFTISAAHEHGVCYALKGNFIDRDTRQNGVGWRNGEMYTLDATDRHGLCYPEIARSLCARADSGPCVDRGQNIVCVQNTGRGWWNEGEVAETLRTPCGGDSTKANLVVAVDCRNMCANEELSGTLQAKNQGGHSLNYINPVCYPIENHPADSRIELLGGAEPVQTLTSRMGTGGGNVPMVLIERNTDE